METILSMLTLVAASVIISGPVLLLAWWLPRREGKRWAAIARLLELELVPYEPHHRAGLFLNSPPTLRQPMRGTRGGLAVEVGLRVVVRGSGKNQTTHYYTHARAHLPRSLDVGLTLAPTGFLDRAVGSLVGETDLQLGRPEIDPHYEIRAAEPDEARRLLTVPYVAEALAAYRGAEFGVHVDDTGVRCERASKVIDPVPIARALDNAVELAQRIASARQALGPSGTEHALQTAWAAVAERHGLMLDVTAGAMSGRFERMHVEVSTRRGPEGQRRTQFLVRFDRPLGIGLSLRRETGLHTIGKLVGMQDIRVGEPIFDSRFVVQGAPEDAVRRALTPSVRARLVDLQQHAAELVVRDDHLAAEVGWFVGDAVHLESAIAAIAHTGAELAGVVSPAAGPYRQA